MDPRTLLILQKMLQRQLLKEIHGCISTGKEANVYHAITESGDHRAIKGKMFRKFGPFSPFWMGKWAILVFLRRFEVTAI